MDSKDSSTLTADAPQKPSIQFYHLTSSPLVKALPKLLERAFASGYRACVAAESDDVVEQLNKLLWSYDPDSFLPHGSDKDNQPEKQPILLSTSTEPLNGANLLVITDGRKIDSHRFERILDIFDGNDPQATNSARERWKEYKNSGYEVAYYSQSAQGGWQKKS